MLGVVKAFLLMLRLLTSVSEYWCDSGEVWTGKEADDSQKQDEQENNGERLKGSVNGGSTRGFNQSRSCLLHQSNFRYSIF